MGKCLIYIMSNGKTRDENYTFTVISIGQEKCTLLPGKSIKLLTGVISDFYFIIARIFQPFKNMHVLPL